MSFFAKVAKALLILLTFVSVAEAQTGASLSCMAQPHRLKEFHGKALFRYPNEHPVSIVTFTQQDLERIREERFFRSLKHATFVRKTPARLPASTTIRAF
jgi:hypothetical protein